MYTLLKFKTNVVFPVPVFHAFLTLALSHTKIITEIINLKVICFILLFVNAWKLVTMFNNVFCKCDPDWFICYASFLWHIVMKITTNTLYKSNLICIWCCVYIIWEGNKKVKCVFMLDFHSSEPVKVLVWKTFIS